MIKRIQIENFKSFGKVDLEPHPKVNLLIGPNSSGKSNFLEALQFGAYKIDFYDFEELYRSVWSKANKVPEYKSIFIRLEIDVVKEPLKFLKDHTILTAVDAIAFHFGYGSLMVDFESVYDNEGMAVDRQEQINWQKGKAVVYSPRKGWDDQTLVSILNRAIPLSIRIFRPNVIPLTQDHILKKFDYLSRDLNEVPVLINSLQNEYPANYSKLCDDLFEFSQEFKLVKSPSSGKEGFITLNFFNKEMTSFSVNEVSEGILLFTAILAILHQPNPPKVILLEEPENGIHPRRLADIIGLIWKLAEEKDVQFFITTHSPIILDQFADSPESVLIFDKEDGISKVKKLSDLLAEKAEFAKSQNLPQLDYTAELSENWLWGLLNGVPHVTSA